MSAHPGSTAPLPLTAVLLAGGQSRRMGTDKALLSFDGQPLWLRQIALLESLRPAELLVSGPRRPGFPATLRNLEDEGASRGPLSGLATALRAAAWDHVLLLAIDLPLMTESFLRSVRNLATRDRGIVPFVTDAGSDQRFYEPLAAIYPRECLALVERQLNAADWSMQTFVRAGVAAGLLAEFEIPPNALTCFTNANTPEQAADSLG